jgi:hypothetical protein
MYGAVAKPSQAPRLPSREVSHGAHSTAGEADCRARSDRSEPMDVGPAHGPATETCRPKHHHHALPFAIELLRPV